MKTQKRHITTIAAATLAFAALAATGCSTPVGETAQEGNKEVNSTMDGIDTADRTVNRTADTTNKTADTVDKVNTTFNRFFK